MAKGCICWVVALLPEAKPLIEKLEMKLLSRDTLHPIYCNETGTDWLVISGVGQLNAASGSATLYQVRLRAGASHILCNGDDILLAEADTSPSFGTMEDLASVQVRPITSNNIQVEVFAASV